MIPPVTTSRLLEQEARALLTRLARVRPFALQETMVPAAGIEPAALWAIERALADGRRRLRSQVHALLAWLHGPEGRAASPSEAQQRYTLVRLRFNAVVTQFDIFADVLTQRSEHGTGLWIAGLDAVARDALELPGSYQPPPVICYLDRGHGAAIRRARTRLPGGDQSPVAIVRVPRERMIGSGIGSSLIHEVGHQGAALLGLIPSVRAAIHQHGAGVDPVAVRMLDRWVSEILADFWSVAKVGISSTLGLMGVVSLPRFFVFRVSLDDPHPVPWIRVKLSCAIGQRLYPHPQWARLARHDGGAVDHHQIAGARARIEAVDETRQELLAGAALAGEQQGGLGECSHFDGAPQRRHPRRAPAHQVLLDQRPADDLLDLHPPSQARRHVGRRPRRALPRDHVRGARLQ